MSENDEMSMAEDFWFNRFVEYWSLPTAAVVEHVRRARLQIVQMGNFGPDFYSVADDPQVERFWAGMPQVGIEANLEEAAALVAQVQQAGARVVGQLSMTLHYGNHLRGLGLFGPVWERLWSPALLGPAPCADIASVVQQGEDGAPLSRAIEGRPYSTYRGCICNPGWLEVLKAMVSKGLALGLDGFNATHNYESFCPCAHCAAYVRGQLRVFAAGELRQLFGCADADQVEKPLAPRPDAPADLRLRCESLLFRAAAQRRKQAFDEVFAEHGRARRPDLLLAQWYHKYDLRVNEERAGLDAEMWARGESYIWYSQGPYKWGSSLAQGYLADMGLPARFMHAAGGGRPFVVNKYDYRRWRVWAAEAMAHGGAALSFHAGPPRPGQEEQTRIAPEDYYGPVIRYQRFMAEHESLLHPAAPLSPLALVYPRRAERDGELTCQQAFKRVGEWLEDGHLLFDIALDEQLRDRAPRYRTLILPDIRRLSADEVEVLERHVQGGGGLVLVGEVGRLDVDGRPHLSDPLQKWRIPPAQGQTGSRPEAGVFYLPAFPWEPAKIPIRTLDNVELPVYARLHDDPRGQVFVQEVLALSGPMLSTDAPWYVRVRAWRPEREKAIVLHWINYLQDEQAAVEIPIPIGPLAVEYPLPEGVSVERVEWRYPEMKAPVPLEFTVADSAVRFALPRLIVHGMSALWLKE